MFRVYMQKVIKMDEFGYMMTEDKQNSAACFWDLWGLLDRLELLGDTSPEALTTDIVPTDDVLEYIDKYGVADSQL